MPKNKKPEPVRTRLEYPSGFPARLPRLPENLSAFFESAVASHPERVFLHFLGRESTYAETLWRVRNTAAALQAMGLKPGGRVALYLPNCPQYVVAFYAVLRAGGGVVNGSPLQAVGDMRAQLNDSGAEIVITPRLNPYYANVRAAAPGTGVRHVVVADVADTLPALTSIGFRLLKWFQRPRVKWSAHVHDFAVLEKSAAKLRPVERKQDDAALLQYTGGTTGIPKGAVLTHGGLLANITQINIWLGQQENPPVFLAVLPLVHVFANTTILGLAVATGGRMVLLPQFALKQVLRTIHRRKVNILHGVPALFDAVAGAVPRGLTRPEKLASLRFGICGGAPLAPQVKTAFEKVTPAYVVEGYGLTEASPVVTCNLNPALHPADWQVPSGSIGMPLTGTQLEFRDLDKPSKVLPAGTPGTMWVKGPQLMQGYWQNPKATAEVMKNGWLDTGDIGYMDARGYVFITGRAKELIIVSGYNVYPRVVEEALVALPQVAQAAVVGVPHPRKGEVPYAFVVLKSVAAVPQGAGQNARRRELENALLETVKGNLHKHAVPARSEIIDSLPVSAALKVLKRELKPRLALRR